ncbi:unnamed protein product [Rotaria socialis]|uniref:Uncharacterized protein n=1 Tax=Rotaria socialis TaxID=392032 RepID=A0A821IBB4_9BILA|nr:unnamed protein product [Rotaria socialis]
MIKLVPPLWYSFVINIKKPQKFVYDIIDRLFTQHPKLAYIKWDCNAYSAINPHQSHLYVDYVHDLYSVLDRLRKQYPSVSIMLRSAISICNHVTDWGKQSLKFRTNVAMMGKLGYDIVVSKLDESELLFSPQVLHSYARLKDIPWDGDLFRLVSPYRHEHDIASLIYVSENQDKSIWLTYLIINRYCVDREVLENYMILLRTAKETTMLQDEICRYIEVMKIKNNVSIETIKYLNVIYDEFIGKIMKYFDEINLRIKELVEKHGHYALEHVEQLVIQLKMIHELPDIAGKTSRTFIVL